MGSEMCIRDSRRGAHRGVVSGRLRAAADDRICHLRGLRLGSGRVLQMARGPHVQVHLHLRDRVLGRGGAGAEHRPHGRDADRPVRERPGAAGAADAEAAGAVPAIPARTCFTISSIFTLFISIFMFPPVSECKGCLPLRSVFSW